MLGFLFRGLTAEPSRGAALVRRAHGRSAAPHWYVEGAGRRTRSTGGSRCWRRSLRWRWSGWSRGGDDGNAASVALTERFIEVMESGASRARARRSDARQDRAQARRHRLRDASAVARGCDSARRLGRRARAKACTSDDVGADALRAYRPKRLKRFGQRLAADAVDELERGKDRMTDRFAHRLRLDQIRDGERLDLVADEAERAAIAKRLGLPALDRLEAHATLSRATVRSSAPQGRLVAIARAKLRGHRRARRRPMSTSRSTCCSCRNRARPAPTRRSSSAKPTATSSSTTARRSTLALRSPIRWRSASTLIRAARAPKRR